MSQAKTDERRAHQRAGPFDGTWSGASGGSPVRIADVSEGGCFVESMAVLQVGERVMVKMALHKLGEVCVGGEVVAFHPGIGFAVRFHELTTNQRWKIQQTVQHLLEGGSLMAAISGWTQDGELDPQGGDMGFAVQPVLADI